MGTFSPIAQGCLHDHPETVWKTLCTVGENKFVTIVQEFLHGLPIPLFAVKGVRLERKAQKARIDSQLTSVPTDIRCQVIYYTTYLI